MTVPVHDLEPPPAAAERQRVSTHRLAPPPEPPLGRKARKLAVILGIILLFLAGIAGLGVWLLAKAKEVTTPKPEKVRLESPALGELIEVVQAPGEIEPKTKVSISARVAARVLELPYKEGETVSKGDGNTSPSVLVRLDSTDLQAALRSSMAKYAAQEAQIAVAQARIESQKSQIQMSRIQLVDSQRELTRVRQLMQTRNVSQSELDQAQRKVDELQAQLDSAIHGLEADQSNRKVMQHNLEAADADITRAKDNLSYSTITSPIDGTVTRVNAKVGELVVTGTMNNPGTVILEVADLARMLVVARLNESDVAAVKVGQKARVHVEAYRGRQFEGVVENIALVQSGEKDGSKYFRAEVLLRTDGERIFSGLTADVDIETSRHAGVLRIPSQAVVGRPVDDLPSSVRETSKDIETTKTMATVVYRMKDGKAVVTPVRIGPSDATHTIVESGLSSADKVITGPYKVLEKLAHDGKVVDELETSGTETAKSDKDARPSKDAKGTGEKSS
jgi:HlyD family secretion protein